MAGRSSTAGPAVARVVGKHCESGDIVVMDEYLFRRRRPGDLIAVPGTGAYRRALSSQYNHTPAHLSSPPATAWPGSSSDVRRLTTSWPWTSHRVVVVWIWRCATRARRQIFSRE